MQKGMPYSLLTHFKMSAAIALPSMSLLWLVLPAQTAEASPLSTAEMLAQPETKKSALEAKPEAISAFPQIVASPELEVRFSQTPPSRTINPPEDEIDPAEDDSFSPLPELDSGDAAEPLPESEAETPEADVDIQEPEADTPSPEAAEESVGPEEPDAPSSDPLPSEALPSIFTGESVPIPVETIDQLIYLDPDPNPLLLQTQPEEVEIIGTQPITLEQAVELAYRNNPDLQIALSELEQSQAALRETQAALFPTISVSSTLQGQNTTESSSFFDADGFLQTETTESLGAALSAQIDVAYNLYSSGGRAASIRAAEEQVRFSELEVERRREVLRINTANEYYDLQTAIEAIRISQAFLEEAERNLRDTSLREREGVGTRFDVLRAEVQVANARQDVENSKRDRQVAQRILARRLNVPPSLEITTVAVEIAGSWPLTLEESIVQAFQNRVELEQQLVQRDIGEQLRRADLSVLGPQVDLFASYQTSDILTQEGGFDDAYQIGAQVSWTLFEGGAARASARQRELDIEIAERNFEETRNTTRLEVESAYYTLQANLTNIDTAQQAVDQAEEALALANLRFDAGVGTQLDILTAQSELTDAEVNLVQAKVGYNRALAELERAISNVPENYYGELPY